MQTPTDKQLWALPKYAQKYIADLERRVAGLREDLVAARGGPEDSNVLIPHFGETDQLLGKNTRVRFSLLQPHPGTGIAPTKGNIDVQHQGPFRLELMAVTLGTSALHVVPHSSNVVRVQLGSY